MVFNDFGENFVVSDQSGEALKSGIVASITKEEDALVAGLDETRHGLEDGDYVTFHEVRGMTELNISPARKVFVTGPFTFKIGDTSGLGDYTGGGIFTQVKQPKIFNFVCYLINQFNPYNLKEITKGCF